MCYVWLIAAFSFMSLVTIKFLNVLIKVPLLWLWSMSLKSYCGQNLLNSSVLYMVCGRLEVLYVCMYVVCIWVMNKLFSFSHFHWTLFGYLWSKKSSSFTHIWATLMLFIIPYKLWFMIYVESAQTLHFWEKTYFIAPDDGWSWKVFLWITQLQFS